MKFPHVLYKGPAKPNSWCRWAVNRVVNNNNSTNIRFTGDTGCLSGDTILKISHSEGTRERTIKELWERFTGNYSNKNGRTYDLKVPSRIRSFDGKIIRLTNIKNVSFSGIKKVFELKLVNGLSIKATADHKIMTRIGWKELQDLSNNDEIMCDTLHAESRGRKRIKLRDIGLSVGKNHPYNIQPNNQISVHTLIYEAKMNNLGFLEYLDILLNEPVICKSLKYIDPKIYHVHHKDGNHYNNSIDNLELLKEVEHKLEHSDYTNFSQGLPKFSGVISIEVKGEMETFDIECQDQPNFVANGIVVHNSGKTYSAISWAETMALMMGKKFTADDIYFSIRDIITKVAEEDPKPGSIFLLDEQQVAGGAKEHQSKKNKAYAIFMSTVRSKRYIFLSTLPFADMADKQVRRLFHVEVETQGIDLQKKTVRCKPRYLEYSRIKDKVYRKRLVITYVDPVTGIRLSRKVGTCDINKPSEELIKHFEAKKKLFQQKLYKQLSKELIDFETIKEEEGQETIEDQNERKRKAYKAFTPYQKYIAEAYELNPKMSQTEVAAYINKTYGAKGIQAKVCENLTFMINKGWIKPE